MVIIAKAEYQIDFGFFWHRIVQGFIKSIETWSLDTLTKHRTLYLKALLAFELPVPLQWRRAGHLGHGGCKDHESGT